MRGRARNNRGNRQCPGPGQPCPYVGCRYHLWTDYSRTGRITVTGLWGDTDSTCAMSFVRAHPGGATCEEVAVALGLSDEYVRQIEKQAIGVLEQAPQITRDLLTDPDDAEWTSDWSDDANYADCGAPKKKVGYEAVIASPVGRARGGT